MFDPIAPATSIGRPTPPTVAFGTSTEDDDDLFDHLLRENERAEDPAPTRSAERRDDARDETRDDPRDDSRRSDEPAEPVTRRSDAADSEPAKTDTDEPAKADAESRPADDDEVSTADSDKTAAPTNEPTEAAQPAVPDAVDPAKVAAIAPQAAPQAAPQVAAAAAAAAVPAVPRASATGQAHAAPHSAAASASSELPTLQSLLAGRNATDSSGQDGAPRQQRGDARLPEALQQLLQRAGGSPAATPAASANGTSAGSSFRAALESTALASGLKPDAVNATPNPAVLPTAAAAPVAPATAAAPLPLVDPLNPLANQLGGSTLNEASSTVKPPATLGATPGRAAAPATTPSLQIAMHIAKAAQDGTNRISVRLDPAELGRVDVRLEVGHDGRVVALVSAERQETLDMLQRDARDLARALKDAGLEANSSDLNFSLRDNGGQETAANGNDGKSGRDGSDDQPMADEPNAAGIAELDDAQPRLQIAGSGVLDIVV
ncbi:MAG: flagellar hook-length control protein FliK [Alphaproteobacteria bacterium]